MTNKLYYGDNLEVLRDCIDSESVDLIYLDPPFNSNASYSVLFKSPEGQGADAQIEAFNDTWTWGPAASGALLDITTSGNHALHTLMQAMKTAIGENAMMAYLAMMAVRLQELHRVLRATGSLFLHCDPTASHYLKLVLDAVFGADNFRNEIVWKRTSSHNDAAQGLTRFGRTHDVIFFYSKDRRPTWQVQFGSYSDSYIKQHYSNVMPDGRRYKTSDLTAAKPGGDTSYEWKGVKPPSGRYWAYSRENMEKFEAEGRLQYAAKSGMPRLRHFLDEMPGVVLSDVWDDIPPINSQAQERLGYPTQKPLALLERIISASSNPGDVVLDPFCGCGTAIDAAQKLGREWIGIDITHLAIGLVEKRLRDGYGDEAQWETIGVPRDLASAQRLAEDDPHQFQQWICWQLGGFPRMKKGGDKGVDGYFYYLGEDGKIETGVIEVKAGANVNPGMVRATGRVMQRDGHKLGLFITAVLPTRGMEQEAASHGLVEIETGGRVGVKERFPALQIFTLAELFQDRRPKLPPLVSPNRKAPRVETRKSHQKGSQGELL